MMSAWIIWWAKGHFESRYARHGRHREATTLRAPKPTGPACPMVATRARTIIHRLVGSVDPVDRAVALVGLGFGVAESARVTGVSRQRIYRRLADLQQG